MLKKSILLVIALLAIGLTVVQAQDMARLEQLERELEQIAARVEARRGSITPQEQQRITQIQQEILQIMGSVYGTVQPGQLNPQYDQMPQPPQLQQQPYQPPQQQAQPQQQTQQQGQNAGWPPASAFQSYFRISPLTQPAGTTARYDGGDRGMEIYLLCEVVAYTIILF